MTTTGLIMTMAVMPIVVALTVGLGGVWLTGDVRVVGLVELAAAIVGAGLVGYSTGERGFDVGFLMGRSGTTRSPGRSVGEEEA